MAQVECYQDMSLIEKTKNPSQLIPLLDQQQACDAKQYIRAIQEQDSTNSGILIAISTELLPKLGTDSFALKMFDDSMMPQFKLNDVLIIDPSVQPQPGNYLVVKINNKAEAIICQYKKLSYTSSEFELLTLNDNWPNIKITDDVRIEIIGRVVQCIRGC